MINHFPVILSLVGATAAVAAFATRRRSVLLYALVTLTLAGLSVYPALRTGHAAAELIKERWYVDRDELDEHHESGERTNIVLIATGVISALALWRTLRTVREAKPGLGLLAVIAVLGIASAVSVAMTSWEGGFIALKNPALVNSVKPSGTARAP
jgi:uncharacterized membrane protein